MSTATIPATTARHERAATPSRMGLRQRESVVLPRGNLVCPEPVHLHLQMGWLGQPSRREAIWLFDTMLAALADRDGRWAITCLGLAESRLSRLEQLHAVWLPLALGWCLLEQRGQPLRHGDEALAALRGRIRSNLRSAAPDQDTVWVVPASSGAGDRSAAHVTAACLGVRATDARPWSWNDRPPTGRAIRCGCSPTAGEDGMPTIALLPTVGVHHISCLMNPGIPL